MVKRVLEAQPLLWVTGLRMVGALAGIAQPQRFFQMLQEQGLPLAQTLPLPDHASGQTILQALQEAMARQPEAVWLCTEKDAAKLWPHQPQALAVPLVLNIAPGFWSALDQLMAQKNLRPRLPPTPRP